MGKAKYIGKCYDRYNRTVYLFYEYRGYEYMITDEHNGCYNPICEQHEKEQERIDREIAERETESREPIDKSPVDAVMENLWKCWEE